MLDELTANISQWQRWRDDHLDAAVVTAEVAAVSGDVDSLSRPPRGVASQGRRLAQRQHWIWVVLVSAYAALALTFLLQGA